MAVGDVVVVAASAARTTTGQSAAVQAQGRQVAVEVDVTAVSGSTPSMTLTVEWSDDNGTTWFLADPPDTFTALTAAGKRVKEFDVKAPYFRTVWTISGTTPSFTFAVDAYFN
jgi:hypothetical protein